VSRRPFLLLTSRVDDALAEQERDAFLRLTGLGPDDVVHVRIEQGTFLPLDVTAYAGVVLGGSPFTVSEPRDSKSPAERRVEEELTVLVRELVERQVPYLGLC
jgi:GMP synthase (glutamine-hydrolysing)